MLPDLPNIKNELFKVQIDFFRWAQKEKLTIFKDSGFSLLYEGDSLGIQRENGKYEVNDFWKISSEIIFEPEFDNLESIFTKLCEMAEITASQFEKNSVMQLSETLDAAGRTIRSNTKDPMMRIIEMIEDTQLSLDEYGEIDLSKTSIIVGTKLFNELKNYTETKECKEKFNSILERKKEEANAREANRKLVG